MVLKQPAVCSFGCDKSRDWFREQNLVLIRSSSNVHLAVMREGSELFTCFPNN